MRARALASAAVLVCLCAVPGCWLFEDPESGGSRCTGGPVAVTVPGIELFCAVDRITGTVTGPDMETIEASIDPGNPTVTLQIPSGEDRQLVVRAYTTEDPGTPAKESQPISFCVDAGQPVTITVSVKEGNQNPTIDDVTPDGGQVTAGQAVSLRAEASDPDGCDAVKGYSWSTDYGTIAGSGANVSWTPQCPSSAGASCQATVGLTVTDRRGGKATKSIAYSIGAAPAANQPPTVSLATADVAGTNCWSVQLTATASDPDGDALTLSWGVQSGQGSLSGISGSSDTTAVWSYGCLPGAVDAVVQVTATDGAGASASATARILNRAPSVSIGIGTTVRGSNDVTYPLTANASDADGDSLQYQWTIDNAGAGSFSTTTGSQTNFTIADNSGTSTVRVTVTDAHGAQGATTSDLPSVITITVNDGRPAHGARPASGR